MKKFQNKTDDMIFITLKKKEKKIQKGITTFIVVIYGEQVKTGVFYLTCFIILFKFLNDILLNLK